MTLNFHMNFNRLLLMLLVSSVALRSARADTNEEEDCGNGCQSYDQGTPQMTRCVRYACRRRVFRYFLRFGKRSDMSPEEQVSRMKRLQFQHYPNHEILRKRYKETEIIGRYRNHQKDDKTIKNGDDSLHGQSNLQLTVDDIIHILRNQQRKKNLLRKMFILKRQ